ncbi:MAG: SDR family oxidoreductase [Acidobacteria bacterium]|nr:SDR family oxidoreductase [Acidobacteriota bacterium]
MNFDGKVVLVTGAARGIGRAIAQQFATQGAAIALHYHSNQAAAEQTLSTLPEGSHTLWQADITNPTEAQHLVQATIKHYGRLDVLVNNAAIFVDHPIASTDFESWQQAWRNTIDTNLIGTTNITYWAAQQMIQQRHGRIVNVSSRGAFRGEPTAPAYGASKAALNAMSQSLAQALAPHNVFVYVVAPGFVDTERVAEKLSDDIRNQSPLKRVAHPEEVAKTVVFLASEGTDFLTGCIVDVNGASYLRS